MSNCTIKYTPVCGLGPDDPVCGLLELDGAKLLLDCGWTQACDPAHLEAITSVLPGIDAVVLTHGTLAHMGALPALLARGMLPPSVPIISTLPVKTLGSLMLHEFITERRACSDFDAFTAGHVTELCEQRTWSLARFYQRLELTGGAAGLAATPYAAGHTLGGALWRLVSQGGQEVVYVTDWCHRKERHLAACQLPELFSRPAVLLLGARCALAPGLDSAKRDTELLDLILSTVRHANGSVMIPVDPSRVLELCLILDEFWAREKYDRVYPLVLLSPIGKAMAEGAQSMLEFMSNDVGKAFELKRDNPFNFRCIKIITSVTQLSQLQAGPKVVLATGSSLEQGAARQLLMDWAADARNTICFVQRARAGTLADTLLRHSAPAAAPPLVLPLTHCRRVPLEGEELEAWLTGRQPDQMPLPELEGGGGAGAEGAGGAGAGGAGGVGPLAPMSPAGRPGGSAFAGAAAHGGLQSVLSGSLPLRSSSAHLSALVRDASGQVVQQLVQGEGQGQGQGVLAGAGAGAGAAGGSAARLGGVPGRAAVLMDGFEPPQGALHPMFPDEDEGPLQEVWDDYGVMIDPLRFKAAAMLSTLGGMGGPRLGGMGPERKRDPGIKIEGDDEDVKMSGPGSDGGVGSDESEDEERPTKLVTEDVQLTVRAAIRYFNYEGLADKRILTKAVQEVCPQGLVVLHGTEGARRELHASASKELQGFHTRVVTPGAGDTADVSVPKSHLVYVSEALHRQCPLHQLGRSGHQGVLVDAAVGQPDPHFPQLLQLLPRATAGTSRQPSGMLLNGAPTLSGQLDQRMQDAAHQDGVQGVQGDVQGSAAGQGGVQGEPQGWLGDIFFADGAEGVKLTEIKKALAAAGIQSTWLGKGSLSCGPVIISKASVYGANRPPDSPSTGPQDASSDAWSGRGHLVVEGALSEQHDDLLQRVRTIIYTEFGVNT